MKVEMLLAGIPIVLSVAIFAIKWIIIAKIISKIIIKTTNKNKKS